MRTTVQITKEVIVYFLLCAGTFGMLLTIYQYTGFNDHAGFLEFKQAYIDNAVWKFAFYTHVFTSILLLAAGFTQFSSFVLKEHRNLHRFMGRIYAYGIMIINFPAGMIMAVYANGLLPSKMAFIILDCLWFFFTYKAVVAIKNRDIKSHKRFMIRSYALTCSAITLRLWKIILENSFNLDPLPLYMIDAWLGFVPNLLFAEWLIRSRKL
jgi:hypothetical protein